MFCRKCGAQNEDGAKFCKKCGERLEEVVFETQQAGTSKVEHSGTKSGKKKIGTVIAVIVALILIMAALVMVAFFIRKVTKEKQYAGAMDRGQRYMEELDYEKAEAEFLTALSIDPKDPKPYLALADVYLAQDEPEKAIEILEQATENVLEDVQKEMEESSQKDIGKKLEEIKKLEKYTWVVEPEIEADDIFYVGTEGIKDLSYRCYNDSHRQAMLEYAVIRRGDAFGLIGYDGKLIGGMDYRSINYYYYDNYTLDRFEAKYESQYQSDWVTYSLIDGEIVPFVPRSIGGLELVIDEFYYSEGIHNTSENSTYQRYSVNLEHPIPIQQSSDSSYYFGKEGLPYALYADGKLVTEFDYEDMGSLGEELVAVKKDGKWGYLNEKGETVIPIEYDGSWTIHPMSDDGEETAYAYADSDGYVTLCKDGKWELRNTKGTLVIMPGVFEKICPVYDGKCWVKRNGKWGVIALEGDEDDTTSKSEEIDYEALYGPLVQEANQTYGNYNLYFKYDIDKDGVDELLLQEGTCEADYMYHVYTIQNKKSVSLGSISGSHSMFYADEEGGKYSYIYQVMGHMGYEHLSKVEIKDGKVQTTQLSDRELAPDEGYYENEYPLSYTTVDDLFLLRN